MTLQKPSSSATRSNQTVYQFLSNSLLRLSWYPNRMTCHPLITASSNAAFAGRHRATKNALRHSVYLAVRIVVKLLKLVKQLFVKLASHTAYLRLDCRHHDHHPPNLLHHCIQPFPLHLQAKLKSSHQAAALHQSSSLLFLHSPPFQSVIKLKPLARLVRLLISL